MSGSRLTLSPRQWYGLQLLGPLDVVAERVDTWTAATPIFVTAVTPLKTGGSIIELQFVRVIAAFQPTLTTMTLKVLHRDERAIVAAGESWRGLTDLLAITLLDLDWLKRLCPRMVERYAYHAWSWYGGDEPSDPAAYLTHAFGADPEQMSGQWATPDAPWPDLMIRQPLATLPYRREWRGIDAWLLLRPEMPSSMDDKWIIRAVERGPAIILSFRRSWTNFPLYELTLSKGGDKVTCDHALVSLNEFQRNFGSPEHEARLLDWLIDNFLLARRRDLGNLFDCGPVEHAKAAWSENQRAAGLPEPDWSAARHASRQLVRRDGDPAGGTDHPDCTDYGIEGVPVGPKLNSFPLHTQEWRVAFLRRLLEVGGEGLLEATSHVWDLLCRPKAARATAIGLAAGAGGMGKKALHNALSAFMEEWMGDMSPPAVPDPSNVDSVHQAYLAHWAKEQEREEEVVARYAALLGGETATPATQAPIGVVLKGPWIAERDAVAGKVSPKGEA